MMTNFHLDFVAVGPQRTGTTWLHQILQTHSQIRLPQAVKETMFFDRYYDQGLSWYSSHFGYLPPQAKYGEIAPTYFDIPVVIDRIHKLNPHCQIIINLRNPLERVVSLYLHHYSKGRVGNSLSEALVKMPQILESGRYAQHIPRWLEQFGADRVMFILLDDVESQPQQVLNQVCDWLEVARLDLPATGHEKVYAARQPHSQLLAQLGTNCVIWLRKHRLHRLVEFSKSLGVKKMFFKPGTTATPQLSPQQQQELRIYYEPDITFVEKLLKRDLSDWRA